jgi:hypothetical protein
VAISSSSWWLNGLENLNGILANPVTDALICAAYQCPVPHPGLVQPGLSKCVQAPFGLVLGHL